MVQSGDVIGGRYRIAEQLGAGGMARVYRAQDLDLGRDVAVKVLADRYAADPAFVERFRREASAAAQLNHPNIVQVFDRGETDDTYYIVMEYLPGPDLKQIIRRRGTITVDESIEAALQILSALLAAHRRDVIHRDVKPQNVIMAEDGILKVTDFGIARAGAEADMTEAGSVIGTAQYISPEQAKGGEVTPASDCYSVGIVLYEMLTGRVPFDAERPVAVAMKQINEPPVPPRVYEPSVPAELEAVVLRALAKRPSERFRTAEEFSAALMDVRAGIEGGTGQTRMMGAVTGATRAMEPEQPATRVIPAAAAPPPVPAQEEPRRRSPAPVIVAVLVLLALLAAGIVVAVTGGGDDETARVTIPASIVGQSEADATATLTGLGFTVTSQQVESTDEERGLVTGSTPPPGQEADEGSAVVLQVGAGPETVTVPNVVGQTEADAVALLEREDNGFTVRVQRVFDDEVPEGEVVSQTPRANAAAARGSQVVIRVSRGPGPVTVPQLVGNSLATAQSQLQAAGLEQGAVTERSSERQQGTVLSQDPASGTKVDRGSAVNLVIAAGPETVSVPNVIGNTLDKARDSLQDAGFQVDTVATSSDQPAGTVVDQSPSANTQVEAGSTITLTVSDGPAVEPNPTSSVPQPPPATTTAPSTSPGATTAPQSPGGDPTQVTP